LKNLRKEDKIKITILEDKKLRTRRTRKID
jgi:hypothetical protein